MNALPPRTHNNPPDPLDEALALDPEALELSEGMLTGLPVENVQQMNAADALAKRLKAIKKAVTEAKEAESKPLHDAWKAALARYKPTEEDLDRQIKGCAALVDGFKRKLAAEKAEAERKAQAEANAARRAAEAAARQASAGDIEAQRAAAAAKLEADIATARATAASKDTVRGLRLTTLHAVDDHRALLNWIAVNRRDDITAFIDDWARRNHREFPHASGLRVWQEKVAV